MTNNDIDIQVGQQSMFVYLKDSLKLRLRQQEKALYISVSRNASLYRDKTTLLYMHDTRQAMSQE